LNINIFTNRYQLSASHGEHPYSMYDVESMEDGAFFGLGYGTEEKERDSLA
jgi:hypothetical protein